MTKLQNYYITKVIPKLIKIFKYNNIHQIPKIKEIIINRGLGVFGQNQIELQKIINELYIIACQTPVIINAKKTIVPFKIKKGLPIGLKITLHSTIMYNFLLKLIHLVLPRIQDFNGLLIKNFDKNGNFHFGIKDQYIFPEIDYENIDQKRGLNISIIISSKSITESIVLLKLLGFPLNN